MHHCAPQKCKSNDQTCLVQPGFMFWQRTRATTGKGTSEYMYLDQDKHTQGMAVWVVLSLLSIDIQYPQPGLGCRLHSLLLCKPNHSEALPATSSSSLGRSPVHYGRSSAPFWLSPTSRFRLLTTTGIQLFHKCRTPNLSSHFAGNDPRRLRRLRS
jgi:hypothetical protein